ncbi:MAG: hypothetical protein AABY64_14835 [Bdellovibrionota bacterium]
MKNYIFYILLFFILLITYSAPILNHPALSFDDTSLLEPLKSVDSLQKYNELIQQNIILDVQPVRDLSFWLELQVEKFTGFRNSQLVNLLIWFFTLLFLDQILKFWKVQNIWRYFIVSLVAFHPAVASSVAWTSARKHLLSAFFLSVIVHLWITRCSFSLKDKIKFFIFYFLLCFSQPINFLAPFLILFGEFLTTSHQRLKKLLSRYDLIIGFILLAVFCVYINLTYYTGDYIKQSGEMLPKFLPPENQKLIFRIFVWGRSFFQLINPLAASPVPYKILKPETFIGIFLLFVFLFSIWIFRNKFWRDRLTLSLLLMASPILMMTVRLTHHLGWDTYLLTTIWSLGLLFGAFKYNAEPSKLVQTFGVIIIFVYVGLSYGFASDWSSDQRLVAQAYYKEGSFFAQENYARQLLLEGKDWTLAKELIHDLENKSPSRILLPYLKARLIYQAPVEANEKRRLFLETETLHPWMQYYFAAFEASQGNPMAGYLRLNKIWRNSQEEVKRVMGPLFYIYVSNWYKMCEQAKVQDCHWIQLELDKKSKQKPDN